MYIVALIAVITVIALLVGRRMYRQPAVSVTYESAKDAIELMRQWSSWMAGIQSGALASLGLFAKADMPCSMLSSAIATVLFMGASLLTTAWVLSALPIVRMNLTSGSGAHKDNDIYEQNLYSSLPVTLGMASFWQHTFWVFGIFSFLVFLYYKFEI